MYQYEMWKKLFQKISESDQNPVPKRKCKRAKPVCFDESILYRQEKKVKDRENKRKRKEQFSSESFGFRKASFNVNNLENLILRKNENMS